MQISSRKYLETIFTNTLKRGYNTECEEVQPLWKSSWRFLKILKIDL
jgi:hypothetical protein